MLLAIGFFIASAGASSAYLTVSEIFPMETRALAIALFYAVGTAIGGITGPLLFGQFIHSGNLGLVALGFFIGAIAMAFGGVAELVFGVRAEQQSLENIARPLTAEEADEDTGAGERAEAGSEDDDEQAKAREAARRAEAERDERIARRSERQRTQRYRPGPGTSFYSPGMHASGSSPSQSRLAGERALDEEVALITDLVRERGTMDRETMFRELGARRWGPRRFDIALRTAVAEGLVRPAGRRRFGPPEGADQ